MSRNASGVYSLPAGNPVISGTTVESDNWANPTMNDIGSEMTDSLSRDGKGAMRAELGIIDGLETTPGMRFNAETGTGMYRDEAGVWGFSVLGAEVFELTAAGPSFPVGVPASFTVTEGAGSGAIPEVTADTIVASGDGNTGISIIGADASLTKLVFGGPTDPQKGILSFDGATDIFALGTSIVGGQLQFLSGDGVEAMRVDAAQLVGFGQAAPIGRIHTDVGASATNSLVLDSQLADFTAPGPVILFRRNNALGVADGIIGQIAFQAPTTVGGLVNAVRMRAIQPDSTSGAVQSGFTFEGRESDVFVNQLTLDGARALFGPGAVSSVLTVRQQNLDFSALKIETDADTSLAGPQVILSRLRTLGANGDQGPLFDSQMVDSAGAAVIVSRSATVLDLAAAGGEQGRVAYQIADSDNAGALTTVLQMRKGIYTGGAVGGDQGADSINASEYFQDGVALGIVPTGGILAFTIITVPTGWVTCNGQAISRTTFAALFAVIGVIYGNGNGTTTFNVPDLRGEFLRGQDATAGNDPDAAGRTDRGDGLTGDNVGTKQADDFKSHNHTANTSSGGAGGTNKIPITQTVSVLVEGTIINATGGNETRPRNVYVTWMIKT